MALSLFNMEPMFTDFERALDRNLGFPQASLSAHPALHINCDIVEKPDRYAIVADAPGMKGDDIHVELHDNVLRVSGEKSSQHSEENKGNKVWRQERSFQKFQRSFHLPEDAKADGISAKMEHGVLTVDIPRATQKKPEPKRIQVTQGK